MDEPEEIKDRYDALIHQSSASADAVDEQIERLNAAANVGEASAAQRGVVKEAAILAALSARQRTDDQNIAVKAVLDRLDDLGLHLTRVSKTVAESVDRFTAVTDASTRQLARWTQVMAWATIALACFAVVQIVVAVLLH